MLQHEASTSLRNSYVKPKKVRKRKKRKRRLELEKVKTSLPRYLRDDFKSMRKSDAPSTDNFRKFLDRVGVPRVPLPLYKGRNSTIVLTPSIPKALTANRLKYKRPTPYNVEKGGGDHSPCVRKPSTGGLTVFNMYNLPEYAPWVKVNVPKPPPCKTEDNPEIFTYPATRPSQESMPRNVTLVNPRKTHFTEDATHKSNKVYIPKVASPRRGSAKGWSHQGGYPKESPSGSPSSPVTAEALQGIKKRLEFDTPTQVGRKPGATCKRVNFDLTGERWKEASLDKQHLKSILKSAMLRSSIMQ